MSNEDLKEQLQKLKAKNDEVKERKDLKRKILAQKLEGDIMGRFLKRLFYGK